MIVAPTKTHYFIIFRLCGGIGLTRKHCHSLWSMCMSLIHNIKILIDKPLIMTVMDLRSIYLASDIHFDCLLVVEIHQTIYTQPLLKITNAHM